MFSNIHFSNADRTSFSGSDLKWTLTNGKFSLFDRFNITNGTVFDLINSIWELLATTAEINCSGNASFSMSGGSILFTAQGNVIRSVSDGEFLFDVVDVSGISTQGFVEGAGNGLDLLLRNCRIPSVFNLSESATPVRPGARLRMIGCSDTTSVANTDSIQDYQEETPYGTIDLEQTVVRTGGADDGATGLWSLAMTPYANSTLESSSASLTSPWMAVWVSGGSSIALEVHISNDTASTDRLQDEAHLEWYTPDAGDTAQFDQVFDAGDARLLDSSTAVTDDTGQTWGSGGNNHQKFTNTVTPGYEGWVYARLHVLKRQGTPDTVFLDPVIVVDGETNMITSMMPSGMVVSYPAAGGGLLTHPGMSGGMRG